MSLGSVEFGPELGRVAAELGRNLVPERVAALQEVLRTAGRIDPETGALHVELDGATTDLAAYLRSEVGKLPELLEGAEAAPTGPVKVQVGAFTSYRRQDNAFAAITRGLRAGELARTAAEVATWPNPWVAGAAFNRTRQTIISNTDPALAVKLKAEARAQP